MRHVCVHQQQRNFWILRKAQGLKRRKRRPRSRNNFLSAASRPTQQRHVILRSLSRQAAFRQRRRRGFSRDASQILKDVVGLHLLPPIREECEAGRHGHRRSVRRRSYSLRGVRQRWSQRLEGVMPDSALCEARLHWRLCFGSFASKKGPRRRIPRHALDRESCSDRSQR